MKSRENKCGVSTGLKTGRRGLMVLAVAAASVPLPRLAAAVTYTAADSFDLNASGFTSSEANSTSGTQQVGWSAGTGTGNANHALLWSGSASSYVDLNPSGFSYSYSFSGSGTQQVGYGSGTATSNASHALLWSGSASSYVDLNPSGFANSYANATSGTQQAGSGDSSVTGNALHALLWSGSASSYVDLNPSGFLFSQANAISGTQQVGQGGGPVTGDSYHALLWSGSAASCVDLNSLVPGSAMSSGAQSIDAYGNIAGYATIGGNNHAVEWLAGDMYNVTNNGTSWNTSSTWLSGTPAAGNDVLLIASDGNGRQITYDATTSPTLGTLTIDAQGEGSMQLVQSSNTLNATNEYVGFVGNGSVVQSGGTHNVSGTLTIAAKTGSTGLYQISNGTLAAGTVQLNTNGIFLDSGGTVAVTTFNQSGGTFSGDVSIGSGAILTYNFTGGAINGAVSVASGGTLNATTVSLTPSTITSLNVSGGAVNFTTLNQNGGAIGSGLTVPSGGAFNYISGTFTGQLVNNGTANFNANFTASNGVVNNGTMSSIPSNVTATFNGAGVTNYGEIDLGGGTLAGTSLANDGLMSGNGNLSFSGSIVNSGQITQAGGTLSAKTTNGFYNTGTIDLQAGRQLQIAGPGPFDNQGTINLHGGSIINITDDTFFRNDFGGVLVGPGTVSIPEGINNGTMSVDSGTLFINNGVESVGDIEINGTTATIAFNGPLINDALVEGHGNVNPVVLTNTGTIQAQGGTLFLHGSITNTSIGTLMSAVNTEIFLPGGMNPNAGMISLTGGTFDTNNTALTNNGTIGGRGVLRTGGLTNNGQIQLSGGLTDIYGAVTSTSGSKITVSGGSTTTFYNNVTMQSGSTFQVSTASTAVFFGNVSGTSFFTGSGTKDFEAGTSSLISLATPGDTIVQSGAALTADVIQENSLTVAGSVTIAPGGKAQGVTEVHALTFNGSGRIDLTNNDLILQGTPGTAAINLAAINTELKTGFNAGHGYWNAAAGIVSSQAAGDTRFLTTLGYRQSNGSPFDGANTTANDVLVKYTYYGDADLNGVVNGADYAQIDNGFGMHLTGWQNGDFNYDGVIDGTDYALIDNTFNQITATGAGALAVSAVDLVAQPADLVAVPEPGAFCLIGISSVALLRRRRGLLSRFL